MKNFLVFVPLLMAPEARELPLFLKTACAFVAFSVCASAVYVANDLLDLAADRRHQTKRRRPFAAGDLSLATGVALVPACLLTGFALAWLLLPPAFVAVLAAYLAVTTAYSFRLKHVPLVDVIVLAMLYTGRVIAGAAATSLWPSPWILGFSLFFFLSLAFVKRYAELYALRGEPPELRVRGYYPTVGGTLTPDDRAYDVFVAFCDKYEKDLLKIIAERVTNTNEVGRSALLAPAFEIVSKEAGAPLGLIEIGPSAGLNLNFDRYGYQYADEAGRVRLERGLNASFVLKCMLKGPGVPALDRFPPPVGSRIGLELSPIDVTQESERRWLKALIWPERGDRIARLEGALRVSLVTPPSIIGGDAVLNLAAAVGSIPRAEARVIYHTIMAYQLSGKQMQTIEETLRRASKDRPVWRVTIEGEISGPNPKETFTPLKVHRYMNGEHSVRAYGVCDPHGLWFEWKG